MKGKVTKEGHTKELVHKGTGMLGGGREEEETIALPHG